MFCANLQRYFFTKDVKIHTLSKTEKRHRFEMFPRRRQNMLLRENMSRKFNAVEYCILQQYRPKRIAIPHAVLNNKTTAICVGLLKKCCNESNNVLTILSLLNLNNVHCNEVSCFVH